MVGHSATRTTWQTTMAGLDGTGASGTGTN